MLIRIYICVLSCVYLTVNNTTHTQQQQKASVMMGYLVVHLLYTSTVLWGSRKNSWRDFSSSSSLFVYCICWAVVHIMRLKNEIIYPRSSCHPPIWLSLFFFLSLSSCGCVSLFFFRAIINIHLMYTITVRVCWRPSSFVTDLRHGPRRPWYRPQITATHREQMFEFGGSNKTFDNFLSFQ